jgi:hypothetical protein
MGGGTLAPIARLANLLGVAMHVRYDRTGFSVVIVCDCGFQDVGTDKAAAWSLAADHERRAHPGDFTIRQAEYMRNARSSKVVNGDDVEC